MAAKDLAAVAANIAANITAVAADVAAFAADIVAVASEVAGGELGLCLLFAVAAVETAGTAASLPRASLRLCLLSLAGHIPLPMSWCCCCRWGWVTPEGAPLS